MRQIQITLSGVEMVGMLKKKQADLNSIFASSWIDEFYELAGVIRSKEGVSFA